MLEDIQNQPEELKIAQQAIVAFFKAYTPAQAKSMLWNWLKLTMNGNLNNLSTEDQEKFINFFDSLHELINAAYSISPEKEGESVHA